MENDQAWVIRESAFTPENLRHKETIFTIGNGYLSVRGAFEEGYPGDGRATFVHGVFDYAPIVMTELANAPDWLMFNIYLNGERFSLENGTLKDFHQSLDLRSGVLTRQITWQSPAGLEATIIFRRFASLANPHLLLIQCEVSPQFDGEVEFRASLKGDTDNEGLAHWSWVEQGKKGQAIYLRNRTRQSAIQIATAMRLVRVAGEGDASQYWDVVNIPTVNLKLHAHPGKPLVVEKYCALVTSRDTDTPVNAAIAAVNSVKDWRTAYQENARAWEKEWERTDVIIEGDEEAQISTRFNLFQLLIAAPRQDDRVNIGAKTLSGFGYRGHSFWDTEIFMLPLFIFTAPAIARNLLNYRFRNLPGARAKAHENGFEGAQFPWESAGDGVEVTPTWVPDFTNRTKMVRIWTGEIELHITADIAYAANKYWQVTGDDAWLIEKGAELILDTAKFWGSRSEWNPSRNRYQIMDVIGPDEYHDHIDNNAMTNRMAQWNLQTGLDLVEWLKENAPARAAELIARLDLSPARLEHWRDVIQKMYFNVSANGLIEQFEGFFERRYVDLAAMEPRTESAQVIFGIEGANQTQVLKQPDVLIMLYLLQQYYSHDVVQLNYDFYTPRTDHTYGSSLGPSIQAIMACEVGRQEEAYEHFIRAVRADLRDARGNARDGIHGASAAGTWQAVVFGFAGLRITDGGWSVNPRLPRHWRRLAFKFYYKGVQHTVDLHD
jgi:trehalose/maltose hydrolase-like predicted phosphorylase